MMRVRVACLFAVAALAFVACTDGVPAVDAEPVDAAVASPGDFETFVTAISAVDDHSVDEEQAVALAGLVRGNLDDLSAEAERGTRGRPASVERFEVVGFFAALAEHEPARTMIEESFEDWIVATFLPLAGTDASPGDITMLTERVINVYAAARDGVGATGDDRAAQRFEDAVIFGAVERLAVEGSAAVGDPEPQRVDYDSTVSTLFGRSGSPIEAIDIFGSEESDSVPDDASWTAAL